MVDLIHVAAAVIVNGSGQVLIARRPEHVHQGGLWEFPGGKLEAGEKTPTALSRELDEELGIIPTAFRPIIRIPYHYPDKAVLLDVWRVDAWQGQPHGREGQALAWVDPEQLPERAFPAANLPILTATRLPDRYLVTPEPGADQAAFLADLAASLRTGIRLVQFRAKQMVPEAFRGLAGQVLEICRAHGAALLLNRDIDLAKQIGAEGVHLTSRQLMSCRERPVNHGFWVAASCHDEREVAHACQLGLDFIVASPVKSTVSHPSAVTLGWPGLERLTERANMPAYALGGMAPSDLLSAWEHGAQGIAAVRSLWAGRC